ncbi:hypothetical protein QWY75_09730 [Pontixanthobacter aestiaquae]|uniref:DUF4129 domain-containing protein n=1 Tax=Pontixanthobacter aestiaquae TaxID=1509367 RepID=A0A844Z631_9SPHN|nr:hypothetical protein [Pontixanthobacter aestiaquae]MDN3646475.1 hypothetical protein [Pontixanthobacter aestiaquae]MXO82537.1 hypothetical protein [Pontixanthobacter aestiaquae]
MTTPPVQIETDEGEASGGGWEAVRADESIQFAPIEVEQPEQPDLSWLDELFRWFGSLFEPVGQLFGVSWPVMKWVLIAAAAGLALLLLWKLLAPILDLTPKTSKVGDDEWVPDEGEAVALLDEADKLAQEGRYDEATHLLLQRSVSQIAAAKPAWVEPSSTARELAMLPALPEAARTAFGTIAERVERSLFALKQLGAEDWEVARKAYAEFALQQLAGGRS